MTQPLRDGNLDLLQMLDHFVCVCEGVDVIWINEAGLRLLCAPGDDAVLGNPITTYIHENFIDLFHVGLDLLAREAEGVPLKFLTVASNPVDVKMSVNHLPSEDGTPYFLVECQDISDLIRASQSARGRENQINAILKAVNQAVITIDDFGIIKDTNDATVNIFGYGKWDMIGENVKMLMPEPHRSFHDQYLLDFHTSGVRKVINQTRELEAQRADGSVFPMELTVIELSGDYGRKLYVGSIRDISKRKKAELQAHQASRLKAVGQLARGIAQEINTPVQFIGDNLRFLGGSSETLLSVIESQAAVIRAVGEGADLSESLDACQKLRDALDVDALVDEIQGATEQSIAGLKKVASIVLAMKEFSYPANKEKSRINLNRVIERTAVVCQNEWKEVADLTLDLAPVLPSPFGLEEELNHVSLTLLVNAAQSIAEKPGRSGLGRIEISSTSDDAHVIVRVADNGGGISSAAREHIFNPFFTTRDIGQGTGQGLSIAHDIIVNKHGGTITFDSVEGEGTTFTVKLPLPGRQ